MSHAWMALGMSGEELALAVAFAALFIAVILFVYVYLPRRRREEAFLAEAGREAAPTPNPDRERDAALGLGAGLLASHGWCVFSTQEEIDRIYDHPFFYRDYENFSLTPDHWPLALTLPFALWYRCNWDHIPGNQDPDFSREMLIGSWGIRTRGALLFQLRSLLIAGHRRGFNIEREGFLRYGDDLAPEIDTPYRADEEIAEEAWRFYRMRANDRGIMQVDFTAWDMFRYAMLCRSGCAAGYITAEEALDFLREPVAEMQACYGSWAEAGEHFRVGRWFWHSVGGEAERSADMFDMGRQQMLIGNGAPWSRVPWEMDVPAPAGLLRAALIVEGLLGEDEPPAPDPFSYWGHRRTEVFGEQGGDR